MVWFSKGHLDNPEGQVEVESFLIGSYFDKKITFLKGVLLPKHPIYGWFISLKKALVYKYNYDTSLNLQYIKLLKFFDAYILDI